MKEQYSILYGEKKPMQDKQYYTIKKNSGGFTVLDFKLCFRAVTNKKKKNHKALA